MKATLTAFASAAAVALSLMAAGPAFSQADIAQLRTEVADGLIALNYTVEGGVESLTDEQVMAIKEILDSGGNATDQTAAIEAALGN
jgi:hypothetical protein